MSENGAVDLPHLHTSIESIKSSIERIEKVKTRLNENATEAKSEILSVVSRQLETLRCREVWLLSQVDLLQATKRTALDQQLKGLWACLGHLQECLNQISKAQIPGSCLQEKDLNRALEDCLTRFNQLDLSPVDSPGLSFQADVDQLRDVILKFGKIRTKTSPLEMAFAPSDLAQAVSLPQMLEDYEDEDHHILYKTVAESQQSNNTTHRVHVTVPRLPPCSSSAVQPPAIHQRSRSASLNLDWHRWLLAQQQQQHHQETITQHLQATMTPHVQQWLNQLHREAVLEDEEVSVERSDEEKLLSHVTGSKPVDVEETMEQPPDTSDFTYFKNVQASPVGMWLRQAELMRNVCEINTAVYHSWLSYFQDISSDINDWLLNSAKEGLEGEKPDTCCGGQCQPTPAVPSAERCRPSPAVPSAERFDIENLPFLACVKDKKEPVWLHSQSRKVQDEMVAKACRANEKCSSFDECVCDENCCQILPKCDATFWLPLKNHNNRTWLVTDAAVHGNAQVEAHEHFNYFDEVTSSSHLAWLFEPANHGSVTTSSMEGSVKLFQAMNIHTDTTLCNEAWLRAHQEVRDEVDTEDEGEDGEMVGDVSETMSAFSHVSKPESSTGAQNTSSVMFEDVAQLHNSNDSEWIQVAGPDGRRTYPAENGAAIKKWLLTEDDSVFTAKEWLMWEENMDQKTDPDRDQLVTDKAQELPECLDDVWLAKTLKPIPDQACSASELSFDVISEKSGVVMDWLANTYIS